MFRTLKLAPLVLVVMSIAGCSFVGDDVTSIKPIPETEYSEDPESESGSRNNPIPFGNSVTVGDWKVRVVQVAPDALEIVLRADPYTDKPSINERFLLVSLKAIYVGEDSGEPSSDLRFKIVGSKGNTFSNSCGYFSDSFDQNGETFPGASISGNMCFTVDSDQINGATVSVQGDYGSDDRKFLSLKP